MAQGYTLEQLQKMGAKPVQTGQGFTLEQLKQMQSGQTGGPTQGGGFLSGVGNVAKGIGNFALGIGKGAVGVPFEMGKNIAKGVGFITSKVPIAPIQQYGQRVMQQTTTPPGLLGQTEKFLQPSGKAQGAGATIGGLASDVVALAAPTSLVAGGKAALEALPLASKLEEIPFAGKAISYATQKVLNALPEAAVGATFSKLKGGSATAGAVGFGILSGFGEIVGDTFRAFKGGLADNLGKAFGITGKMGLDQALEKIPGAQRALSIISKFAPEIKVKDSAGVEKIFDPKNATFGEFVQALKVSKEKIYSAYSEMAQKAGDKGASFTEEDFLKTINSLEKFGKDATSATKNKVASLINDIRENFGTKTKEGGYKFANTALERIQKFIENINVDVNPLSDKAGSEVSGNLSRDLREKLDSKIEQAGSKGYQKLRNSYKDLKSIENDSINQFKKALRGSGSRLSQYIEAYGGIDTIVGLLTHGPAEAVKGGLITTLGAAMRYLRDPEVALRNAFEQLQPEARSALSKRLIGGPMP